jgi:outer membrane protein
MSDKIFVWFRPPFSLWIAVCMWAACATLHARDWEDVASSPIVDPLLTRPPVLDVGKSLPGDALAYMCANSTFVPAKPLTLSDAIDLALCHNPQLQSAWGGIKVHAAQLGEAKAAYFPTLNAGVSHVEQKNQYSEAQFQVNSNRTIQSRYYTLTWRLLDFGGRDANRRSANALLEAALASHDAILQKTIAVKSRLVINALLEQFRLFGAPVFQRLNG